MCRQLPVHRPRLLGKPQQHRPRLAVAPALQVAHRIFVALTHPDVGSVQALVGPPQAYSFLFEALELVNLLLGLLLWRTHAHDDDDDGDHHDEHDNILTLMKPIV